MSELSAAFRSLPFHSTPDTMQYEPEYTGHKNYATNVMSTTFNGAPAPTLLYSTTDCSRITETIDLRLLYILLHWNFYGGTTMKPSRGIIHSKTTDYSAVWPPTDKTTYWITIRHGFIGSLVESRSSSFFCEVQ